MTATRMRINIMLVAISASYLTLGVASSATASSLWWVYGLVSGALASLNLWLARCPHSPKDKHHG